MNIRSNAKTLAPAAPQLCFGMFMVIAVQQSALAQGAASNAPQVTPHQIAASSSPVVLPDTGHTLVAEGDSSPPQQFDLTPVRLPERGSAFGALQNFRTGVLYHLPAKMFFEASCENTLRLETNVLQRRKNGRTDAVYRVLPNVTLGYSFNRTTRVSGNFFYFRDEYFDNSRLSRNIGSLGLRGEHDFLISPKTTLTTSFFGRELFITHSHNLLDLIPGATMFRRVGQRGGLYSSVLGQIRWGDMFERYQEFDQFYSVGALYRTPNWSFVFDNTLIDNFGKSKLRGLVESNHQYIMTLEAGRKVSSRLPVVAFVRAQPIFNMGNDKRTGFAGFDFRLFGGIRAEIAKPAIFPVKLRSS